MAIARNSTDLWSHVQKRPWSDSVGKTVLFPVARTIRLADERPAWHVDRLRERADVQLAALEEATTAGRERKAQRLRTAWLHTVYLDRIGVARKIAAERDLRLDAMGRGPVFDRPAVHFRDRLPWDLTPVAAFDGAGLPFSAGSVLDAWSDAAHVFDVFYAADEPAGRAGFRTHSLIGVVSPNGHTGDWFVLDRWAS